MRSRSAPSRPTNSTPPESAASSATRTLNPFTPSSLPARAEMVRRRSRRDARAASEHATRSTAKRRRSFRLYRSPHGLQRGGLAVAAPAEPGQIRHRLAQDRRALGGEELPFFGLRAMMAGGVLAHGDSLACPRHAGIGEQLEQQRAGNQRDLDGPLLTGSARRRDLPNSGPSGERVLSFALGAVLMFLAGELGYDSSRGRIRESLQEIVDPQVCRPPSKILPIDSAARDPQDPSHVPGLRVRHFASSSKPRQLAKDDVLRAGDEETGAVGREGNKEAAVELHIVVGVVSLDEQVHFGEQRKVKDVPRPMRSLARSQICWAC
jgi:hypothetical protein